MNECLNDTQSRGGPSPQARKGGTRSVTDEVVSDNELNKKGANNVVK